MAAAAPTPPAAEWLARAGHQQRATLPHATGAFSSLGDPDPDVLELDGERGGGQLVRTALALSAVTGEPFRMEAVRGSRPEPGLKPQHLACVRAVREACDGTAEGAERGSEAFTFEPGRVAGGDVTVDVGTAGSVALVFDALVPLAYALPDGEFRVRATGGTDVKWAPTMAYHCEVKLPLLSRFGLRAAARVDRPGFYPEGGGEATLRLAVSTPDRLDLTERGPRRSVRVHALASEDLADAEVVERLVETVRDELDPEPVSATAGYAEADSTGASVCVVAEYERSVAGAARPGERGLPAEELAAEAVADLESFQASGAAVDSHAADQVMVPLAIGGGEVTIPRVTDHVASNAEVIRAFGGDIEVVDGDGGGDSPRLVSGGSLGESVDGAGE